MLRHKALDCCTGQVKSDDTVCVVGSSHSAILVLMNLLEMKNGPCVVNLYRSSLKYAKFRDDGTIVLDNTGLKVKVLLVLHHYCSMLPHLSCNSWHWHAADSAAVPLLKAIDNIAPVCSCVLALLSSQRITWKMFYKCDSSLPVCVDLGRALAGECGRLG